MAARARPTPTATPGSVAALREPLSFLFRLAKHLKAQREVVRGKPENFNRPDYNFRLRRQRRRRARPATSRCSISTRRRGAPLDLIVSEAMILANSTWGGWLGELGVPGDLPQPGQPGARRQGAHGHQGRCRTRASA